MIIAVIDGMGGGIGAQIVTLLRQELPLDIEIIALGANAIATDRMMKANPSRGASGENAIRVSVNLADFIVAPIGVVIPNSMMGEITPAIAEAMAGTRRSAWRTSGGTAACSISMARTAIHPTARSKMAWRFCLERRRTFICQSF